MPNHCLLTIVVPTIGRSPVLEECLNALASEREPNSEIVAVIDESLDPATLLKDIPDRVVAVPANAGFAAACNAGVRMSGAEFVAVVNDDVVVNPQWARILLARLQNHRQSGAVQGVNLQLLRPAKVDGRGIAWNSSWQAVQIGHGSDYLPEGTIREIYGTSGTAAMYSRRALVASRLQPRGFFDPILHTYYEDVDLAGRLRSAGFRSELVPEAKAQHLGGASSSMDASWRYGQIYSNRILVLARLLGRSFWPRCARILWRDLLDLSMATLHREHSKRRGILVGWSRASRLFSMFRHRGAPLVPISVLYRFMETRKRKEPERK